MNEEKDFFKTCFNIIAGLEVKNESQAIAKEVVLDEIENLQQENQQLKEKIEKTNQKLELLLNDLKINSESEKESGKSYFNTNLFAIRVKEISKTLKYEKDENKKSQNSH